LERLLHRRDGTELGCHCEIIGRRFGGIAELKKSHRAGDSDDRHVGAVFAEHLDGLEPVHLGHEDVDHCSVEALRFERLAAGGAVLGGDDLEAARLEDDRDCRTDGLVVVDDKYGCHR